jgi:hypothetical protein
MVEEEANMYTDYNMYNNYYGLKNYGVRQEDMGSYDDELISLAQAIDLIRISIMDEKKDQSFLQSFPFLLREQ